MTARFSRHCPISILLLLLFAGCVNTSELRGKVAGLREVAAEAKKNGADRCAPRELATAESQLLFAELELDQGFPSKAVTHVSIAEPNAHAALANSPPEYCVLVHDRDGDGLIDSVDKCPDDPENYNGIEDQDGCPEDPDTDGDKIRDSLDSCVLDPEDPDQYLDTDGCPDVDNDSDGIIDAKDKCPNDAEDPDGYEDEDGCPDIDNDRDTVIDADDQCPNEIGPANGDPKGCPRKAALAVVTDCEVRITQQIHFEYDKAVIRRESYPVLDAVADVLVKNPQIKLEIQGHTDNRGSASYNKKLSDNRAASVLKYLVSRGTSPDRLTSKGYGLEQPLVPNDSDMNRALNRRVQFVRTEGMKEGCSK
jgi:OmpA-OmpF porin, OOP family